jgi:hypothetical protein
MRTLALQKMSDQTQEISFRVFDRLSSARKYIVADFAIGLAVEWLMRSTEKRAWFNLCDDGHI